MIASLLLRFFFLGLALDASDRYCYLSFPGGTVSHSPTRFSVRSKISER